MRYSHDHINALLYKGARFAFQNMATSTTPLDVIKKWIASNTTKRWIKAGFPIEKKDLM